MAEPHLVGPLYDMPNSEQVRMIDEIGLPQEGGIPQGDIVFGDDAGAAADGLTLHLGDEEVSIAMLQALAEELLVRDIVAGLEPVMTMEQSDKGMKVGLGFHLSDHHGFGLCLTNAPQHLGREPLFGCLAVQGIADTHPLDGIEATLAQALVAEHLLLQMTQFVIEHPRHLIHQFVEHPVEKQLTFFHVERFVVFTLAKHSAMGQEERGKPGGAVADHGHQSGPLPTLSVGSHCHIRFHTGRGLAQAEVIPTLKERPARRQAVTFCMDGDDIIRHIFFHDD